MSKVYPELQDWVARRDHGGAAPFQISAIEKSIKDLRSDGADLVIVEIHGGFQFSDVASEFATRAAHASIDAGADLVVGHHPHVLQGLEWYKGRLIAYSLGNFVFDQDFLSTFPSVILRTIFEGDRMIDARIIPLTIDRYEPVPVAGAAAARVIRMVNARSALTAYSDRIAPRIVASVIEPHLPGNATISDTGMTGEITGSTRECDDQLSARRLGHGPTAAVRDRAHGLDRRRDRSRSRAMGRRRRLHGRQLHRRCHPMGADRPGHSTGRGRQPVLANAPNASPRHVGALDRSPGHAIASLVRQQLPACRWRSPLLRADAHAGQGCRRCDAANRGLRRRRQRSHDRTGLDASAPDIDAADRAR